MMKYALNLASDGRILSATYPQYAPVDAVLVDELPSGETETERDISNYLYIDGEYVYNPVPAPVPVKPTPGPEERILELEAKLKAQDELIDILLGVNE